MSAKLILRTTPNSKGQYPLAIRITKDRRSTYKHIGHYIDLEDWDDKNLKVKKSNPEAESLNTLIASKLSEARKGLISLQTDNKAVTARQIKKEIYKPTSSLTFFDFADEHLEALEAEKKINRHSTDSAWLSYIEKYCSGRHLTFQEIDNRFLKKFKAYLIGSSSLTETTAMNVMVLIRLLFNQAIKHKVISKEIYPFGKDKFKIKFPETNKTGLSCKEIKVLENLTQLTQMERHSLNVWLFSFYFAGMRVSDVLFTRWAQIYDNRLHYRMGKNSKLLSLKIPVKVEGILLQYIDDRVKNDDFIFPEMKKADLTDAKDIYRKKKDHLKKIAKRAGIQKKVTMHIARHSFGNIAGDNIHPLMLQKLYRHSDLKTTINYQSNFIHRDADNALDEVINF